jgi:hypothetical protein
MKTRGGSVLVNDFDILLPRMAYPGCRSHNVNGIDREVRQGAPRNRRHNAPLTGQEWLEVKKVEVGFFGFALNNAIKIFTLVLLCGLCGSTGFPALCGRMAKETRSERIGRV